ncbi:MAG: hypothetical protein AB1726_12040 [Planctomycetota bacterium]
MSASGDLDPASRAEERLEAWAAGRLDGAARRAFEAELAADPALAARARLQAAIDDSLRRSFAGPAEIRPLALAAAALAARRAGRRRIARLLAAAAVLLALLLAHLRRNGPEGELAPPGAPNVAQGSPPAGFVPAPALDTPDLEAVYRLAGTASEAARFGPELLACGEEEPAADDGLSRTLEQRFGQAFRLSAEARRSLFGPFRSPEWPTAAVFVAFPAGAAGRPVVLVVESEEHHRCCLSPREPPAGLRSFIWPVGKVRVTEITPLAEPRLLYYFEGE